MPSAFVAEARTQPVSGRRVLLVAPSPPPYGGMALQAGSLEKLLRGETIPVTRLSSNFSLPGLLRHFNRVPLLRTLLRAILIGPILLRQMRHADVVHLLAASWLYFFLVVYPTVIVGRLRGKRVIVNYRGGEAKQFFRWYGWLARPVFRLADVVTTPSQFLAEVIRERFRVPVLIVPNILDSSAFRYRARARFEPRIVVTRHLEKIYDIESVLKAFRVVQGNHSEASLWIAGTGSQEEHLRRLVSAWDLKNVRFLGAIPHADLPAIYDQCDIFLNASRVDNFPGALMEASASGLAVVSTCAGGIPFIYQDGKTAVLVEPGDWQALARGVERVLQDPALAESMTTEAVGLVRGCAWTEVRRALYMSYAFPPLEDDRESIREYKCIAG